MRACEGCRRRKIKCDAATTNAWPCAACIRLKLNCVPPTVSYENKDSFPTGSHTFEIGDRSHEYDPSQSVQHVPTPGEFQRHHSIQHPMTTEVGPLMGHPLQATYADAARLYQTAPYGGMPPAPPNQENVHYGGMQPAPLPNSDQMKYQPQQVYPGQPAPGMNPSSEGEPLWRNNLDTSQLTEALGELKIDHTAVGKLNLMDKNKIWTG